MGDNSILLRKYQDDLNVCGMGVIILGAWDIFKVVMQLLLDGGELFNFTLEVEEDEKVMAFVFILVLIVAFLILASLIFLIHFYIGRNASKAAKGLPHKKGYYTWAVILLVLSILSMYGYVDEIKDLENIETTIASIIVDVTSIYILGTVVISTRKIKALKQM